MVYLVIIMSLLWVSVAHSQSTCSGGGADVKYISSVSDWADINNTSYNVFCVAPGDYKAANQIFITQDGTSGSRKYLLYYNNSNPTDNRNPVNMQTSERAIVKWIELNSANYWTIKQLNVDADDTQGHRFAFELNNSANNIVENNLIEESYQDNVGVWNAGSDFNTIRGNVIRESKFTAENVDRICVIFYANTNSEQRGNIVEDNEIYNCTQAMQFLGGVGFAGAVYPDTIVRNNDMYVTSDHYTDCAGNPDPNGNCFGGEEMFVLKEAGTGPTDIVWIYGNRIWGLRKGDSNWGAPGGNGEGILVYGYTDYVLVENNILHETTRGLQMEATGTNNKSAVDNIVYDMQTWVSNTGQPLLSITGDSQEWYRNTFVIADAAWRTESTNLDFRCNTLISIPPRFNATPGSGTIADYNFYYNTTEWTTANPDNDVVNASASAANNSTLTFTRKRITNPEIYSLPNVLTSASSPHFGQCDPNLGSRTGIGVDDRDWSSGPSFVFTVADNGNTTVSQGASTTRTLTATTSSGTSHSLFFWYRGSLPTGVSLSFDPPYCNPGASSCQTTATISTSASTPTGNHNITMSGESGQWVEEDTLVLTVQGSSSPTVSITSPTSSGSYLTGTSPIVTIAGAAADDFGVDSIEWENTTTTDSGSGTGCSGQTSCSWSVSSIPLDEGINIIEITAIDGDLNTDVDTIEVSLDTTAPSQPSGLTIISAAVDHISLDWDDSTGSPILYRIYRCSGSGCTNWSEVDTSDVSTYTDTGVLSNTLYRYQVTSEDGLGNESAPSSIVEATTSPTFLLPDPPTSLSHSAVTNPIFPGDVTSLSDSASTTPAIPGSPTSLSDSAAANPTFPGQPTGVTGP